MTIELTDFDPAQYLDDENAIAGYLTDALETGDNAFIADALGVVARAKGMKQLSDDTGLSRESLYRALSVKGNPEFGTVLKVVSALGLKLTVNPTEVRTI